MASWRHAFKGSKPFKRCQHNGDDTDKSAHLLITSRQEMAGSTSNSFALLGIEDGFQQVPSKKAKRRKSRTGDKTQILESLDPVPNRPLEVSEDMAGASSETFQQVRRQGYLTFAALCLRKSKDLRWC